MKKIQGICFLTFLSIFMLFTARCKKDDPAPLLPVLKTISVTDIGQSSAKSGGEITDDGGAEITARGVCWSKNENPTLANNKTIDGTGKGSFTSSLSGLAPDTWYHVRAYATNSAGTGYGGDVVLRTEIEQITDIDGNVYTAVAIGTQVWMVENLKVTRYNDSTPIPLVTDNSEWSGLTTPGYCWYNNDQSYKEPYGALYNWLAVNTGKLCPKGWHVPSQEEWNTLINFVGNNASGLKENSNSHWINSGGSNYTGFTALPGGVRFNAGTFANVGLMGVWWSSSVVPSYGPWSIFLMLDNGFGSGAGDGIPGNSVRCIKD
jgi:uncharacterized protein (TIGR02145 family)